MQHMLRFLYTQHNTFMQYIQNTKGAVCRFHAPWSARQLLPILEAMKANKNVVQSGYMCLFKYLQHGYYYYRSSSIGDSLSSFYVCEGSKNLSDWTFGSWPISLEQQILVLQELDVATMVHSRCQNTKCPEIGWPWEMALVHKPLQRSQAQRLLSCISVVRTPKW